MGNWMPMERLSLQLFVDSGTDTYSGPTEHGLVRLELFGTYALQKNAYIRVDFVHNRSRFNEWTYNYNGTPFLYRATTPPSTPIRSKA